MTTPVKAIEGTWEEIVAHAPELAGHRVRVLVLPEGAALAKQRVTDPEIARRLAIWEEIDRRCANMHPKPDLRDYLREGRAGAMWGYEPSE